MKNLVLATIITFAVTTLAIAQETSKPAMQVHGFLGGGGLFVEGERAGLVQAGGSVEGKVYKGLGVGVEASYLAFKDAWGEGFGLISPNATYHFPTSTNGKITPFITGGYSLAYKEGTANLANFGGGVDYWPSKHVGIRFDLRDHVSPGAFGDSAAHFLVARIGILGR